MCTQTIVDTMLKDSPPAIRSTHRTLQVNPVLGMLGFHFYEVETKDPPRARMTCYTYP